MSYPEKHGKLLMEILEEVGLGRGSEGCGEV
jgi:hypothetical protein